MIVFLLYTNIDPIIIIVRVFVLWDDAQGTVLYAFMYDGKDLGIIFLSILESELID